MNVYIVPTPAIRRGFDRLETGSRGGDSRTLLCFQLQAAWSLPEEAVSMLQESPCSRLQELLGREGSQSPLTAPYPGS